MRTMLYETVPYAFTKIEDDMEAIPLTPHDKEFFFVIGLVRRPCDYLLSWYIQQKKTADFKEYVKRSVDGKKQLTPPRTKLLSDWIAARYGTRNNLHCMVRTHNLKADFMNCIHKYQACGGTVVNNGTNLSDLVDAALSKATTLAHSNGRSVGDHSACTNMFDSELITRVLATEQPVIDTYDLGQCCSPTQHKLYSVAGEIDLELLLDLD